MKRAQSGSIAVSAVMFLLLATMLLGALGLGSAFYARRDAQKMADMSALAAAQGLQGTNCASATIMGNSLAVANGATLANFSMSCGTWDPVNLYVGQIPNSPTNLNAVQVKVSRQVPIFFSWMYSALNPGAISSTGSITATATAIRALPVAVFSIDAQLLNSILGCIAGCGAIANVNLSTLSFLNALGVQVPAGITVGGLKNLLSTTSPTYNQVLNAIGNATQLNLGAALNLNTGFGSNLVNLLTADITGRGLLTIDDSADASSVLNANLNALNLIQVAAGVANDVVNGTGPNKNAISVNAVLPGVLTTKVGVIQPPSIGIGGVGTTAYSAQIRVYLAFSTLGILPNTLPATLIGLVATVNFQIAIDVANAKATLTSLCTARDANNRDFATFNVSAPLLRVCVGNMSPSSIMSQTTDCSTGLSQSTVLSLLSGAATVKTPPNGLFTPLLPNDTGPYSLEAGQSVLTSANPLAVGTTLSTLTTALTAVTSQLVGSLLQPSSGSTSVSSNTGLASILLTASSNSLGNASAVVKGGLNQVTTLNNGLNSAVQSFLSVGQTGITGLLQGVSAATGSLLNAVSNLVGGLLTGLVYPCGLLGNNQDCLASTLDGKASGYANTLLAEVGLVANVLQPVLNAVGQTVATLLDGLLGANLGQSNLTLISLDCIGKGVRLVQ